MKAIVIDDFLGYSAGIISYLDSYTRYSMETKNAYKILKVESGTVKITFNGSNVLLKENQCLFVNNDTSIIISSVEEFELTYLQFNETLINNNHELAVLTNQSKLFGDDKVFSKKKLKGKFEPIIDHYLDLLFNLQVAERSNFNYLLAQNTLHQIVLLSISLFKGCVLKNNSSSMVSSSEKILNLFNKHVVNHIKYERNVKFYLDELGFEHAVLNKLCIANYGVSVKNYLDLKCLHQIKYKLETTSLSIKEISDYFNFSDTSNFLRFFKRLTNMTATQYREQLNNSNTLKKAA